MDFIEIYNRLQELISSKNHFNLLIKLSNENNNKIKSISLDIRNITYLLENNTYDVIEFKSALKKLYDKINFKVFSKKYIEDLENKLISIDKEISSIFESISNITFSKLEINSLDYLSRLEASYYNYCIEKLNEYLNNYNNNIALEYDYLNDKIKDKLKEEVFINTKPKIREK